MIMLFLTITMIFVGLVHCGRVRCTVRNEFSLVMHRSLECWMIREAGNLDIYGFDDLHCTRDVSEIGVLGLDN